MKVFVAALVLVVLAACGPAPVAPAPSTPPGTPAGTPGQAAGSGVACARVAPVEVVAAALGLRLDKPRETVDGLVVTCRYPGGADTTVRVRSGADAASFARGREELARSGAEVVDLPGFHDEAYTGLVGSGEVIQHTVVARRGSREVMVSSGANPDATRALVGALLDR